MGVCYNYLLTHMIDIRNKEDCCGCTACNSICAKGAIQLVPDTEGFLYPQVEVNTCINCHLCEQVCPIVYRKENHKRNSPIDIYAVRNKDIDVLMNSSSGGFFSNLALYVLRNNGIVFGAAYTQNMQVKHIAIESVNDLWKLRGSKYVQSNLNGIFRQIKDLLKSGRFVLFSGTPCQVEGLNLYLRKNYDNLITVDLVCHAVPSPKLFCEYISYLEKHYKGKVEWMNMRDKLSNGWNHYFKLRVWIKDKKPRLLKNSLVSWLSIFGSELASRPSCHNCHFTNMERPGDFTIADFWDDRHLCPEIYSRDGTSLCMLNTRKAQDIFGAIQGTMFVWRVTTDEAWQECLERPTQANPNRKLFWELYNKKGFEATTKKFCYVPKYIRYTWRVKAFIAKLIGYAPKN